MATINAKIRLDSSQFQGGLNRAVTSASQAVQKMSGQFGALKNIAGFGAIGAAVGVIGQKVIEASVPFEKFQRQLLLVAGGAEAAKTKFSELQQAATLPGLDLASAVDGQIRLQVLGYTADEATAHIKTLAKNVAAFGGGGEEMKGVILAFSQISSKGQVFAEEINQIAERLPTVRTLMKEAFGTANAEEIQKMNVSAREFTDAMMNGMAGSQQVTSGLAEELAKTKMILDSMFAEGSGVATWGVKVFNNITKTGIGMAAMFKDLYKDIVYGQDRLKEMSYAEKFAADMQEKLANSDAKRNKEEEEAAETKRKSAEDAIKAEQEKTKAFNDRIKQTSMAVSAAGTDKEKLAEVNAELKRLNLVQDQETLLKRLKDAQEGRLALSEKELDKINRYLGLLGQRKSLEEAMAAAEETEKAKQAKLDKDKADNIKKVLDAQKAGATALKGEEGEDRLLTVKRELRGDFDGGKSADTVMNEVNEAAMNGKELADSTIEAYQQIVDLKVEQLSIEKALAKEAEERAKKAEEEQKAADKENVKESIRKAGMNREERVGEMREKNEAKRNVRKAFDSDVREEKRRLRKALGNRSISKLDTGGVSQEKFIARVAAENVSSKYKNALPDSLEQLIKIKDILAALAAA
jgi:tape measure domain-containing protein